MDSRSDLSGLLGRVEEATGADNSLGLAIVRAIDPAWIEGKLGQTWACTASLDAALGLCERQKASGIDAAQLLHQALEDLANGGWRDDQPIGPQIALCLLAAVLRALIAQGEARPAEPLSRSGRQ